MLGREPEEVAKFLAKTQGLNKTMIGEYLGEREEVCLKVMHAYVDAMDFAGMDFDAAIRYSPSHPPSPSPPPSSTLHLPLLLHLSTLHFLFSYASASFARNCP